MTNSLPQIGQTIVTNANGSVTITTVTDVKVIPWPTPMGWSIIALLVAAIVLFVFLVLRKSDSN